MSLTIDVKALLDYTDWERSKWLDRFQRHGSAALAIGVGPHGDGRFATVGAVVRHIFSAELRYGERLLDRTPTDTAVIPTDDAAALFAFGRRSRQEFRSLLDVFPADQWDVVRELTIGTFRISATPRKIVLHVLVHEMKHWAQVGTFLRLNGLTGDFHDVLFSPALNPAP